MIADKLALKPPEARIADLKFETSEKIESRSQASFLKASEWLR